MSSFGLYVASENDSSSRERHTLYEVLNHNYFFTCDDILFYRLLLHPGTVWYCRFVLTADWWDILFYELLIGWPWYLCQLEWILTQYAIWPSIRVSHALLGWERDWLLKTNSLPIVNTSNLLVLRQKVIGINRKETEKLGSPGAQPLAVGAWLPHKIRSSATRVILPNLVVLGKTVRALLRGSTWKFDPSRLAFQGRSRSLEPSRI